MEKLIEEKGLKAEDVLLWIDWQSIYQDDKEEKLKGVKSLIKYATLCDYIDRRGGAAPGELLRSAGYSRLRLARLVPGRVLHLLAGG